MASGGPAFPAPVAPSLPIGLSKDESDIELPSTTSTPVPKKSSGGLASISNHSGPQHDESLETLSIHEQMVDEAIARSPETARADLDFDSDDEKQSAYLQTEKGRILQERLSNLVAAFRARSLQAKQMVLQPPPPEPPKPPTEQPAPPPPPAEKKDGTQDGPKPSDAKTEEKKPPPEPPKKVNEPPPPVAISIWKLKIPIPAAFFKIPRPASFDPHARIYITWLTILSVTFLYNAITIPYRAAFEDQDAPNWYVWLIFDYICDALYVVDLIIWRPSIKTFINGIETGDRKEIVRKYIQTDTFKLDVLCLVPLDFFYLIHSVGINPMLRLPRLLKIHVYWELLDRIDQLVTNPYYFRVLRSVAYMMYLIHANACLFYYLSYLNDFNPNDNFVYNNGQPNCTINKTTMETISKKCNFPGDYSAYIFCFFFSVSMVTIIGNLNFPGEVWEMVYSVVLWFIGVFVFATLVGQIRDVLKAMTRQEDEFYEVMDAIVEHMHTLKIPKDLQDRVRTWLLFNWEQQKTIDERHLLDGLPTKLRTDLAMEVHFSTIHKVQLFKDVDKKVLEELLLKLRPSVYLPGDFICKKGEIGKEMYIIKSGILEVVLPDGRVAVTLSPGSVFGEISLLALAGGNRRTADVRSKGFSNLYVLSKADLNSVMKDYPEQFEALKQKAHELMNKGKPAQEKPQTPPPVEIIPTRPPTPEMVRVALNILKPDSELRRRMSHSAVELSALDFSDSDDEEDPEVAMATIHHSDERSNTPDPIRDVPTDVSSGGLSRIIDEVSAASSKNRRQRSRANQPSESSESENDRNQVPVQHQRRRKISRASSKSGKASPAVANNSTGVPTVNLEPAPITATKTGSLTSLKRRLFNVPRVYPIETGDEPDTAETALLTIKNDTRKRVFSLGPAPQETTARIEASGITSMSDQDYSNLTDTYAGVTFSSPGSP